MFWRRPQATPLSSLRPLPRFELFSIDPHQEHDHEFGLKQLRAQNKFKFPLVSHPADRASIMAQGLDVMGYALTLVSSRADNDESVLWIEELCVDAKYRRRRLGAVLLNHALLSRADQTIDAVSLISRPESIKFYESIGFEIMPGTKHHMEAPTQLVLEQTTGLAADVLAARLFTKPAE